MVVALRIVVDKFLFRILFINFLLALRFNFNELEILIEINWLTDMKMN